MHDVAVTFDRHQLVDTLGSELRHPADVVAGEIDEHDVLGSLLGVLDELSLEPPVLLVGGTAPPGAGDGARHDAPTEQLHHRLGGGADDRDTSLPEEEHVRAGVDLPQHPIDVERVAAELEVEALRQHHLERVAGTDVLLGDLDGLAIASGGRASPDRTLREPRAERRRWNELVVARPLEVAPKRLQAFGGAEVGGFQQLGVGALALFLVEEHVVDERDPLTPVVEGRQLADDRHDGVRVAEVVRRRFPEPLDLAHDVVAEIADEASVKWRQLVERRRPEALEERFDTAENALVAGHGGRQRTLSHLDVATARHQCRRRRAPDEREAAPALAVLDRLEEKAGAVADHGPEGSDRGQGVGHELSPDGEHRVVTGELAECLELRPRPSGTARGRRSLAGTRSLPRLGADHVCGSPNR